MNATTEHAPAPVPAPDAGPGAADAACAAPPAIAALRTHAVARHRLGEGGAVSIQAEPQVLASEVPIALVFNGISHAVMMGTPSDLEDFALGFALTEGILDSAADCYGIEVRTVAAQAAGLPAGMDGIEVQLDVASRCFARLKDRRRSMSGRTGCGVCGVDSFAALDLSFDPLPAHDWIARVDADTGCAAIAALPPLQLLNAEAGAV
ncbi:MAG: formate dehydrogenase accessory sulfurtransferase FdhD, partial [Delftia acidovorans]|nr:formate dehydrogenase accessory sulfurtransferase FdhD [Delftia acidovorans]